MLWGAGMAMTVWSACLHADTELSPGLYSPSSALSAEFQGVDSAIAGSADFNRLLQKQLRPDTLTMQVMDDGSVVFQNKLQRLNADISTVGVRFTSLNDMSAYQVSPCEYDSSVTSDSGPASFSLQVQSLGRNAEMKSITASQLRQSGDAISVEHEGLTEQFSNTVDGIRQDFVITQRPQGQGLLTLQLRGSGACFSEKNGGVAVRLNHGGRQLTYDRLKVLDANNQPLIANMSVGSKGEIAISVRDENAVYPLTIDPTVSDANWTVLAGHAANGVGRGTVYAIAIDATGDVYVGGSLYSAGNTATVGIAKWDGKVWSTLAGGITDAVYGNPAIYALAFDSAGNLYAGGQFSGVGGVPASNIAKWNGSSWSSLAAGIASSNKYCAVKALAIDGNDQLYAGGCFTRAGTVAAKSIAKWNGSKWSALGAGVGPARFRSGDGCVYALAVRSTGELYVGGHFVNAGTVSSNDVAMWTGSQWSSLGTGLSYGDVFALALDAGGTLYAGGFFTKVNGVDTHGVAKWDGQNWSALGAGVSRNVYSLTVNSAGKLYAGGDFIQADGQTVNYLAQWDGNVWSSLGEGINPGKTDFIDVYALAINHAGDLLAGGDFSVAGNVEAGSFARWNGLRWNALGNKAGLSGHVEALVMDEVGNIYVGGRFTYADGLTVNNVAKWNGTSWSKMGKGLAGTVHSLVFDDLGMLIAGGWFYTPAGNPSNNVAQWNGVSWVAMGTGMNGEVFSVINDHAGHVYAGGDFSQADNAPAPGIATWDGQHWSAFGSMNLSGIRALAFDSHGALFAGGEFSSFTTGSSIENLAKWDGQTWLAVGAGLDLSVTALTADNFGNVYVAGSFRNSGTTVLNGIAKWSGTSFSALGTGFSIAFPNTLILDGNGKLYVGGLFDDIGGITAHSMAVWDGNSWSALTSDVGSFFGDQAYVMRFTANGDLLVGGDVTLGSKGPATVGRLKLSID